MGQKPPGVDSHVKADNSCRHRYYFTCSESAQARLLARRLPLVLCTNRTHEANMLHGQCAGRRLDADDQPLHLSILSSTNLASRPSLLPAPTPQNWPASAVPRSLTHSEERQSSKH